MTKQNSVEAKIQNPQNTKANLIIHTQRSSSTQPCIPVGSLNRVPALIGWGKGGNVTSAGWQITLCDPIWHVSSRSGAVLVAQTAICFHTLPYKKLGETDTGIGYSVWADTTGIGSESVSAILLRYQHRYRRQVMSV